MAKSSISQRSDTRAATRIQRGLEERSGLWNKLLEIPLLWAALAIAACSWLLLPRLGTNLPTWSEGEVASFDVMVPRDMTVPDEAATEAVRQEARDRVLPVYDLEPRLQYEMEEGLRALFSTCREQQQAGELQLEGMLAASALQLDEAMQKVLQAADCDEDLEQALLEVVTELYREKIVDGRRALESRAERGVVIRNLGVVSERVATLDDLSDAIDLRTGVEPALRNRIMVLDAVQRRWIRPTVQFLEANLEPNLVFNRGETATRVRQAAEQVAPRSQVFRRGQILIRRGDTVSPEVERTLRLMHEQGRQLETYSRIGGTVLLVVLITLGWWQILKRLGEAVAGRARLSMLLILMTLFIALDRFTLFLANAVAQQSQTAALSTVESYQWGIPYAAGAIAVLMLLGTQAALIFSLFVALTAGVMLGGDFSATIYALGSCLVGALVVRQFQERTAFTKIGLAVGGANMVLLVVLELHRGFIDTPRALALSLVAAFVAGPLSVWVASFLLPLLESIFGITTNVRLLELSNQNLPLLKRLSLEAPGTYQHSLAVGNLAEAGADAVGADSLLLRVCAYYHDIGKLVKPEYFVENQRGRNPHDTLSPSMSALVIQSHVKEGLARARKVKLPLPIRQAIATHHGTKLIRFFYDKAKKVQDPELGEVRREDYRYAGPKPNAKELGILLLADAVEAAARTLETPTPAKIQNMIKRIFSDTLEDGQLDQSEMTFLELDKIASAFLWVLTNMYHHRIDYPGFDFNRRQDKREPSSGSFHLGAKTVTADG